MQSLETHKVTEPTAEYQDWAPAFSPNGKQLAFIRTNGALTMGEILVMPANGGEAHRLTFDNTVFPAHQLGRETVDRSCFPRHGLVSRRYGGYLCLAVRRFRSRRLAWLQCIPLFRQAETD